MLQSDILRSARGRLVWGDRKNAKPKFTKGGRDSQGKMRGWRYEGIVRYNESVMDVIGWRKKTESTRLSYPSSQHVSYRPCFYSVPSGLKGEILWLPAPLAVPTWMPPRFELRVSEPWGWLAHRPEALLRSKHLMTSIHFTLSSSPPCGLEQPDIGLCNWNPQKQHLYIALISNSGLKHLSPRPQGPFGWSGMISRNTNATKYLQLSHLFFMVGFLLPKTRFRDYERSRSLQLFEPMFLHKSSRRIRWNNGAVTLFRLSWFYGTNSTSTILQKLVKYQDVNSTYLYRRKYHYHFWTSISVDCTTSTFHNGGTRRSTYSLHPMHIEILLFTKETNWILLKKRCVSGWISPQPLHMSMSWSHFLHP